MLLTDTIFYFYYIRIYFMLLVNVRKLFGKDVLVDGRDAQESERDRMSKRDSKR